MLAHQTGGYRRNGSLWVAASAAVLLTGCVAARPSSSATATTLPTAIAASRPGVELPGSVGDGGYCMELDYSTSPYGVPLYSTTAGLAVLDDAVWVALQNEIIRIDPKSMAIVARVPRHRGKSWPFNEIWVDEIAAGHGSVWVPECADNKVLRIDASTNQVVATISIDKPVRVLVGDDGVWVVQAWQGPYRSPKISLSQVDPRSNQLIRTVSTPSSWVAASVPLAVGHGTIWAVDGRGKEKSVLRIAPETGVVAATIATTEPPAALTVTDDAAWVVGWNRDWLGTPKDGHLLRIDPRTNAVVATIALPIPVDPVGTYGNPRTLVRAHGNLIWVLAGIPRVAIDQTTRSVVETAPSALRALYGAGFSRGAMWLAGQEFYDCKQGGDERCRGRIQAYKLPGIVFGPGSEQNKGIGRAGTSP